jgi:hypothetical protein
MDVIKGQDHFLEVKVDNDNETVNITGNKEGLIYLGKVCLNLSEKKESEHWHLSFPFFTLSKESTELIISKK